MTEENNVSTLPEDFPELECSKCGKRVRPKKVKFLKRTKALQILCPECNQYTIAPKDENWEKAVQKLIEMGVITEEDLLTKKEKEERGIVENEDEETEEKDEYTLLKEILDDEKKITRTQKKHILEWAKMKPLSPHEVYSLLIGFGVKEDIAKRVSTAYAYALEKERIKKERYMNAVDEIYRSVTPRSFTSRFETPTVPDVQRSSTDVTSRDSTLTAQRSYQQPQYYQQSYYQPYTYTPPRWYDQYGYGSQSNVVSQLISIIQDLLNRQLKQVTEADIAQGHPLMKTIENLQKQVEDLREQLMRKEFQTEIEKRDEKIRQLESMLASIYQQLQFSQKPEKIQELEVKKETLESLADRIETAASEFLNFLKWQTAITRGVLPPELQVASASEDEVKKALDRLKKAAKKKS